MKLRAVSGVIDDGEQVRQVHDEIGVYLGAQLRVNSVTPGRVLLIEERQAQEGYRAILGFVGVVKDVGNDPLDQCASAVISCGYAAECRILQVAVG